MNVSIPAPVFLIVSKIIMVANFDLPYVTVDSLPSIYKLPSDTEVMTDYPDNLKT